MNADFYAPTDLDCSMSWGANCGPAAIAAACGLELAAVRGAVSKKSGFPGHMGIPDVERACRALGRPIVKSASSPGPMDAWPRESTHIGMVEIQGPWSGDKWKSAKRRHLIAARWRPFALPGLWMVYDINAGEWVAAVAWSAWVMDPLAREFPGASGLWNFSWRGSLGEPS